MSDSSMLARPASALRYSPTNLGDQPDAFSLLSGVATAAYDATFSQGEDYSTISQPRAELRPTLSPYITERQPSLPAQNLADPYHMAQMQQTHHHHHAPQPLLSSAQTYGASSLGQGSWWNAANFGWPGRAPWPAPGHENISSFMTRCPPIIIDSEQQRPASEVSSESSLGSLPPEEQDPYHMPPRGALLSHPAQQSRPPYPLSAPAHQTHHPYLAWSSQVPSPASSTHSLAPHGRQESPVWAGFNAFTLSDHSSRPSSANADGLSPEPSPLSVFSRSHSMDSTSDLLAAASVDQFTQSDPESGPVRRSRQRARNSDVLPIGDEPPPADLTSKTTKATQQAAIARRKPGSEARFECPYCHSTFTRSYNLKGHIRAHLGQRPFACTFDGCAKAFARHHDLKRHMELHAPSNRRHHCASCSKSFKRLEALLRHYQLEPEHKEATSSSSAEEPAVPPSLPISTAPSRPSRKSNRVVKTSYSDASGEDDEEYRE